MARPSLATGLLRALRPRQWTKNALVLAAPAAAGVLDTPGDAARALVAFVVLSMAAGATYLLNDAADVDRDRMHPVKRARPIAAGVVSVRTARVVGVVLVVSALAVGAGVLGLKFGAVVAAYLLLTTAYTVWLKHMDVLDLVAVASGFVLRAIAGAVAVGVPVSRWFFIVACFGSLFVVAGKRSSEQLALGVDADAVRPILGSYPVTFLVFVRSTAAGVTLLSYCLWAFEKSAAATNGVWFEASVLPFVVAILRYALLLERGGGAAPEELLLRDRTLLVAGGVWATLVLTGVHAG
ncbi:MAG TPA: decaprenyl-phosphate phosphoribosyltransferase [Acidimicrobiales bacterium]|nr:decaprenyl-phosphate phosphoribosyltransferase [Acidimicrobiales bacterium]